MAGWRVPVADEWVFFFPKVREPLGTCQDREQGCSFPYGSWLSFSSFPSKATCRSEDQPRRRRRNQLHLGSPESHEGREGKQYQFMWKEGWPNMLLSLGKLVSINSLCFSINKSNLSTAGFFGGGTQEVKQIQSIPACQGIKKWWHLVTTVWIWKLSRLDMVDSGKKSQDCD